MRRAWRSRARTALGRASPNRGGASSVAGRADDDEYALRERLASFERETRPMLAWYERRGVLASSMPTDRRRM